MIFTDLTALINQAIVDGACDEGLEFLRGCKDLEESLETVSTGDRIWAVARGYEQFEKGLDWEDLNGGQWAYLVGHDPDRFASRCPWNKLDCYDIRNVLRKHPELWEVSGLKNLSPHDQAIVLREAPGVIEHVAVSGFSGSDWSSLLIWSPQLAERCDWCKLGGVDWYLLLMQQPQLDSHCDWTKLASWQIADLLKKHPGIRRRGNFVNFPETA